MFYKRQNLPVRQAGESPDDYEECIFRCDCGEQMWLDFTHFDDADENPAEWFSVSMTEHPSVSLLQTLKGWWKKKPCLVSEVLLSRNDASVLRDALNDWLTVKSK